MTSRPLAASYRTPHSRTYPVNQGSLAVRSGPCHVRSTGNLHMDSLRSLNMLDD